MKKTWKITIVLTLAVMAFSGCGKADTFAYKQFDNIQFTGALEDSEGLGIAVGGQTGMRIQEDGSFSASYYAMDMEDTGEDYQGGTMYYGSGFGQIAEPVRVDDYTYKAKVESITYSEAGEESLQGDMRMGIYRGLRTGRGGGIYDLSARKKGGAAAGSIHKRGKGTAL